MKKQTKTARILAGITAFLLAAPLAALAASITLPATNQTRCYDQDGKEINCTNTGQDGNYKMGAAWPAVRFLDNGDGTFTDTLTGLVWLKDNTCLATVALFKDNLDLVNNLADGKCGLTDGSVVGSWRLPNLNEAISVLNSDYGFVSGNFFKNSAVSILTSTVYKKNNNYNILLDLYNKQITTNSLTVWYPEQRSMSNMNHACNYNPNVCTLYAVRNL